jgi:hypothetical protein
VRDSTSIAAPVLLTAAVAVTLFLLGLREGRSRTFRAVAWVFAALAIVWAALLVVAVGQRGT